MIQRGKEIGGRGIPYRSAAPVLVDNIKKIHFIVYSININIAAVIHTVTV